MDKIDTSLVGVFDGSNGVFDHGEEEDVPPETKTQGKGKFRKKHHKVGPTF